MPISNTGFETNVSGWTGSSATLSQSSTHADVGTFAMQITSTGSPSEAYAASNVSIVNPGATYTFGASLYSAAASRHALLRIRWFDSGMNFISWQTTKGLTLPTGSWSHNPASGNTPLTAPSNAAFAQGEVVMDASPATGSIIWVDQVTYTGAELTVSVTYEPVGTLAVPGYQVTVAGLSTVVGATQCTLVRQTSSGTQVDVRGMSALAITADTATATDFEYSYQAVSGATEGADTNWFYFIKAQTANGGLLAQAGYPQKDGAQSRTDVISTTPYATAIIQSIQQPALSLPIVLSDFPSWAIPGRVLSTNYVLGRENPVVLTDAIGGRTGTFQILFHPALLLYSHRDLKTLLTFNDTFMLQPFYQAAGVDDMFFKITDVAVARVSVADTLDTVPQALQFSVNFTEVDRPLTSGEGTTITTWNDLLINPAITTWNDVVSHWSNWLGVLNDPSL